MALIDKLKAIADGFRASRGTTKGYSLDEMAVLAAEKVGGSGGDGSPRVVESLVNIETVVSVTWENYYTHAMYNGVRLPKIPENVLVEYPYAYILSSNAYFGASSVQPYISSSGNLRADGKAVLYHYDSEKDAWVLFTNQTTVDAPIDGLTWTNVDIPNGSATATDIYFYGSEPVPTD